jgi:NAD(P)-dependent dehydrogenase (short-subunit alcohol dehydrogenase family)
VAVPAVVVLGGRNLGGQILDAFLSRGWSAAGVSLTEATARETRARGAAAYTADVRDPAALAAALASARADLGDVTVVVNAVSLARSRPPEPFHGGPLADSRADSLHWWTVPVLEAGFAFFREGARALQGNGSGGSLIQITNGYSRRPAAGRALWSAAHAGLRAMTHAAAQELRPQGIRACLLVVDAPLDNPATDERRWVEGVPIQASADQSAVAEAVVYLAGQDERAASYELVVTPSGQHWQP